MGLSAAKHEDELDMVNEVARKRPAIFYGWIVVAVAFVTLGVTFGVWYSFSVFFLAITEEFGWSKAAGSSIFSAFVISQACMGVVAGHLQDRFGPRMVIPFGSVVLALSLWLTSNVESLWSFRITYGLMGGASASLMAFSSHSAFIPKWFERKRGLAMGIAMSGIGFGMLIIIPMVEWIITVHGWRTAYRIMAAVALCFIGPLNLILSRRQPQDLNLRPDGDDLDGTHGKHIPAMTMKVLDNDWATRTWTISTAIKTGRFWLLMTSFFFGSWVYQGILLHSISSMVDSGVQRDTAAFFYGILGLAGSAGKILFGYLSDIAGRERVNSIAGLVTAIGIACLLLIPIFPGSLLPLLFAVSFGLGYGAAAPLFPSVSADIFLGSSFGVIFAMLCLGGGFGGSSGAYVAGLLHDFGGDYILGFSLCFLSIFLSCLLIWLASPGKVRRMIKSEAFSRREA